MSNAAKHKKRAAEFELQKQFDKAVASYARAIEVADADGEEIDVALLNKVGDLNLRLGRVADAVESYERAVGHYTAHALYNNAIALCNKILRHAPGRSGIYLSLGRICGRKGMRGDATRNLLEYARRMKEEGRTEEAMRSLAEVAALMPELEEVRQLVAEHAERVGISLPTAPTEAGSAPESSGDGGLVFLDIDFDEPLPPTPPIGVRAVVAAVSAPAPAARGASLDDLLIFDPTADDEPPFETPAAGVAVVPDAVATVPGFEATSAAAPAFADGEGELAARVEAVSLELAAVAPVTDEPSIVEPGAEALLELETSAIEPLALEPLAAEAVVIVEPVDGLAPTIETDAGTLVPAIEPPALPLEVDTTREAADAPESEAAGIDVGEPLPFLDDVATPVGPVEVIEPPPFLDDVATPVGPVEVIEPPPFLDDVATSTAPVEMVEPLPFLDDVATPAALIEMVEPLPFLDDVATPVEPVEAVEPLPFLDDAMTPVEPVEAVEPLPFLDDAMTPVEPVEAVEPLPFLDDATTPAAPGTAEASSHEVTPAPAAPTARVPRLDPHDFILPGELPPIQFPERLLPGTASSAAAAADDASDAGTAPDASDDAVVAVDMPSETLVAVSDDAARAVTSSDDAPPVEQELEGAFARAFSGVFEAIDEDLPADELEGSRSPTASSAVLDLALERCRRLRDEVDAHPGDWARRRRLAEALFEAGEREYGLEELAATALGLELEGALADAARVVDELVRIVPAEVTYHQKRVELAVRLGDRDRLRESYLDLADALVRLGHANRAEPVYVRVLELDPWDDRARAALGDAAPPPPAAAPPARRGDEAGYVSLAEWLADDDAPRDTRMRMEAPEPSGDEDADFDRLLQHFREGVARSLGEDDYDSHYDLGVAYKEMGLLDDAIAEFQRALRSPTYRLPAYEALGQCFIEQGSFPVAVTVLSRALHEPGLDDVQRVGVLFLLGYACEALQRRDEAWSYYQRVYATDSSFRDVAERLAALDRGDR